jgi:hypothetical protein
MCARPVTVYVGRAAGGPYYVLYDDRLLTSKTGWNGSWRDLGAIASGGFSRILSDPGNPLCVYVKGEVGIHKSLNGGVSFSALTLPAGSGNGNTVYAGMMAINPTVAGQLWIGVGQSGTPTSSGIWRSDDYGVTWVQKKALGTEYSLTYPTVRGDVVYWGYLNSYGHGAMYISLDAGDTWNSYTSPELSDSACPYPSIPLDSAGNDCWVWYPSAYSGWQPPRPFAPRYTETYHPWAVTESGLDHSDHSRSYSTPLLIANKYRTAVMMFPHADYGTHMTSIYRTTDAVNWSVVVSDAHDYYPWETAQYCDFSGNMVVMGSWTAGGFYYSADGGATFTYGTPGFNYGTALAFHYAEKMV